MKLSIVRDGEDPHHNLGQFFVDGRYFGETLEDADRFLEQHPADKVPGDSAIPRGTYRVSMSFSGRFQKMMPLVEDVPGFTSVRIHGGNTEADTEGCPLLGSVRVGKAVANCSRINERLQDLIQDALDREEEVTLEIS